MRLDRRSPGRRAAPPPSAGVQCPVSTGEAADHWPRGRGTGLWTMGHVCTPHPRVSRGQIWLTWLPQLWIILTGCSSWLQVSGPLRQHLVLTHSLNLGHTFLSLKLAAAGGLLSSGSRVWSQPSICAMDWDMLRERKSSQLVRSWGPKDISWWIKSIW